MTPPHDPVDPVDPDPTVDHGDPGDPGDPPAALTEDEEQQVAALVADALGHGPVAAPPAVAARLDDVLAGLVAERSTTRTPPARAAEASSGASVVTLESRRSRLPRTLLAAAAVVVGGYAVGNLALDATDGGIGGGSDAASSADGGGDSAGRSQVDPEALEDGRARDDEMSVVPTVRRDRLAADVRRVVRLFEDSPATGSSDGDTGAGTGNPGGTGAGGTGGAEGGGTVDETRDCPVPRLTDTQRLYEVRFRGEPAGMVLGPRRAGQVDVTVYSCSTGGVELARSVPAP